MKRNHGFLFGINTPKDILPTSLFSVNYACQDPRVFSYSLENWPQTTPKIKKAIKSQSFLTNFITKAVGAKGDRVAIAALPEVLHICELIKQQF